MSSLLYQVPTYKLTLYGAITSFTNTFTQKQLLKSSSYYIIYTLMYPYNENKFAQVILIYKKHKKLNTFRIELPLSQEWASIQKNGLMILNDNINKFNSEKGEFFVYSFYGYKKLLSAQCHIVEYILQQSLKRNYNSYMKISQILSEKIYNCIQISTIPPPLPQKPSQAPILSQIHFAIAVIEMRRRRRPLSRERIESNLQEQETYLINTFGTGCINYRQYTLYHNTRFCKLQYNYIEKLNHKFNRNHKILRVFKYMQYQADKWHIKSGCWGAVHKIQGKFYVNPYRSINAQTNYEMERIERARLSHLSIYEIYKQYYSLVYGTFVRKTPLGKAGYYSFMIEKRMLAYLRTEKCYSINYYYWSEDCPSISYVKYFYSNYHPHNIFDRVGRTTAVIKAILTLLYGLIFLHEQSVSHRDLKPDNVLLSKEHISKIIDFGSSCHNKALLFNEKRGDAISTFGLKTNPEYNLIYQNCDRWVKERMDPQPFHNHSLFDMHAFGVFVDKFLGNAVAKEQIGELLWDRFRYVSKLCREHNPQDRPTPNDLYVLFSFLIKLIKV